jgi:hypothetical protein
VEGNDSGSLNTFHQPQHTLIFSLFFLYNESYNFRSNHYLVNTVLCQYKHYLQLSCVDTWLCGQKGSKGFTASYRVFHSVHSLFIPFNTPLSKCLLSPQLPGLLRFCKFLSSLLPYFTYFRVSCLPSQLHRKSISFQYIIMCFSVLLLLFCSLCHYGFEKFFIYLLKF